ncbi:hypothetical protein [Aquimarina sediminis]|uniref:hypothetical protein n=1 Tax=Aquimarina sediminis TaxID=2070536 RepID=UPI000CA0862E|nr:hypothetical protein [Aquimarina sediminis]
MSTSHHTTAELYQNLGKLFYAIAAADKVIHKSEYDSLREIIKSEWSKVDDIDNDFGIDVASQIEVIFEWLDYKELNAEVCFNEFEAFYKENKSLFTSNLQQLIWVTTNTIAGAFSGKNKSELIMLGRLKLIFEKATI